MRDYVGPWLAALSIVACCAAMVGGVAYAFGAHSCSIWEDLGKGECRSYLFASNYVMHDGEWVRQDMYELKKRLGALRNEGRL
jgi:hypothetical protein